MCTKCDNKCLACEETTSKCTECAGLQRKNDHPACTCMNGWYDDGGVDC